MKITGFDITPLKLGRAILQVRTDKGITGVAELSRRSGAFEAYLESTVKPLLIGEDPRQIDRHWENPLSRPTKNASPSSRRTSSESSTSHFGTSSAKTRVCLATHSWVAPRA